MVYRMQFAAGGSSPHTRGALSAHAKAARGVEDHPRIRGEHLRLGHLLQLTIGIIPAYAGSTMLNGTEESEMVGSSPHTRGAPATDDDRQISI